MKGFVISVIASLLVAAISFFVGRYFAVPIFIYELEEKGSDIALMIKNVGMTAADRTRVSLLLANEVKPAPVVRRQYWTGSEKVTSFLKVEQTDSTATKVVYDDLGRIDQFERKEALEMVFLPAKADELNKVKAHDVDIRRSIEAFVFCVDDIDVFEFATKWGSVVILLVLIAYTALGYQYAKSRQKLKTS